MADIAKLSAEQLLTPAMKTGVERLTSRIVSDKQGKKAYLLAELLREKLGDLAEPKSPEERAYVHMLMELDVVSIPLHPEEEVIALLHETGEILLDQNVDLGERLYVKLVDLPHERREAFRKRLMDAFSKLSPSPALEKLKQQIASFTPQDGFFVRHADGSWERVGGSAPPPPRIPSPPAVVAPTPVSAPVRRPTPPPAVRPAQRPSPPLVGPPMLQQKQPPRVVAPPPPPPRPAPPKAVAPPLPPPRQAAPRKPQVHDIKPPQPLTSPFDQLRTIDLGRLASHSGGSEAFFTDVEAQIRSFQKGGVAEYAKAVAAWRESPLFDLYRSIARASLASKEPFATVIASRKQRGETMLDEATMEVIRSLNERLRLA